MLFWTKKRDILTRSVGAVIEALEERRHLTVTLTPSTGIKVPTTTGAIIKPWVAVNGVNPAPDPGMEELIAFQKSPANPNVEAMLVQVNHWQFEPLFPNLTTPNRLYLSADGGTTWHERDFNTTLDGFTDRAPQGYRVSRPDSALAFDPSGNLYLMALSEGSSLLLDRITVANINIVTSGGTLGQLPAGDTTVFNDGSDAPSFAVGRDPIDANKTAIYVFDGTGGKIYGWHGSSSDSIRYTGIPSSNPWTTISFQISQLPPVAVGPNGTLYAMPSDTLYSLPNFWAGPSSTTAMQPVATILNDVRLVGSNTFGASLAVDSSNGTIYFAKEENKFGLTNADEVLLRQITVTPGVQAVWSAPVVVDQTIGRQKNPSIAVDPVTHAASVLYFTTDGNAAGDTTSLWPRLATQSAVQGGWIHLNLTATAIPSLSDTTGPSHANYTGLSVYNGQATAAWSGKDSSVNVVGNFPYFADAENVSIQNSTDYVLNVSAPANVAVTLKHPLGSPISVSFDGF